MKVLIPIGIVVAWIVVIVIGLNVPPRPFPAYPQEEPTLQTTPLPQGLPAPVERFYRQMYGDAVPVIETAVITGKAHLRFGPIGMPGRFRFTHRAGYGYRHYIEATFFGFPLMRVNERYLDGRGRMELPWTTVDNEPKVNRSANQGLWAESIWLSALYLTDPRVRWEPVDEHTAILVAPFEGEEERFVVRFDPESGWPALLETMRYREADSPSRTLWINETLEWGTLQGRPMLISGALIWLDQGYRWAVFSADNVVYNVDVQEYLQRKGI